MDTVKFVPMLVGLLLAVVMVGAVFVPVISSSTSRTITTEIENEGAGWLALGYNEGTNYSFTVGYETITVEEVESEIFKVGNQTGDYGNMICYADPQRTLFVSGDYWYLLTNGENPSVYQFTDTASVTNASGTLTILDGSDTIYTGASPTWAYVPDANGVYGFFTEGGLNLEEGKPTVAVGSYAGVFAYNNTVVAPGSVDLGLIMSGDYASGEVSWIVNPNPTEEEPATTTEEEPATTTPVIGSTADWNYSLAGSGSNRFVGLNSYIGAPTSNLIIPSKLDVDGTIYDVRRTNGQQLVTDASLIYPATVTFDDGIQDCRGLFNDCANITAVYFPDSITSIVGFNNCVNLVSVRFPSNVEYLGGFTGCTGLTSLQLPNATNIMSSAFSNCTNLKGDLIIPDYPTNILGSAFSTAGFDGSLVIGKEVIKAENYAFEKTHFKNIINLSDATFTSVSFRQVSSVKEILNLGNSTFTTTSYGLNADSVQDRVTALGYIAPTSIRETEVIPIDSPVAGIMQLLPLIAGIGALFFAVGTMIYTRF